MCTHSFILLAQYSTVKDFAPPGEVVGRYLGVLLCCLSVCVCVYVCVCVCVYLCLCVFA